MTEAVQAGASALAIWVQKNLAQVAAAVFAAGFAWAQFNALELSLRDAVAQLRALRGDVVEFRVAASGAARDLSRLEDDLRSLRGRLDTQSQSLADLRAALAARRAPLQGD